MISKEFRVAFLFSFLCHVLLICLVSVVFLPNRFALNQHTAVIFLGSILHGSVTKEQTGPQRKAFLELPFEAKAARVDGFLDMPLDSLAAEKETFAPDRFIVDVDKQQKEFAQSFLAKKMVSSTREIIFQPDFRAYPEWGQQALKVGAVVFNIFVSADGLVEEVVNLQASGDPEIDTALARYLRRWRFAPVPDNQGQWQRVKMRLDFASSTPLSIELGEG